MSFIVAGCVLLLTLLLGIILDDFGTIRRVDPQRDADPYDSW